MFKSLRIRSIRVILPVLAAVCMASPLLAGTIPITGTVRTTNGNLFNGSIQFTLNYSAARDTCSSNIVVAQVVSFPVANGSLPSTARITPNDCLSPARTTYTARYITTAGQPIAQNVFYIQGASFNIGSAIPTPLTTSNISFGTFTGLDSISAKNIDNIRMCDQFTGATAGAKIAACIADLPSTGGTADARGLLGSQSISSPILVDKKVEVLLGAATYAVTSNSFSYSSGGVLVVRGLGPGITTINLSGSGHWNFNPAYATNGMGFSDLTINSASTSQDAVTIGDAAYIPAYVNVSNVRIYGPSGTSGNAAGINIKGIQVSYFENVWVFKFPGDCLHIDGDGGGETNFKTVQVDSCGDWGVNIVRTTTTQSGGWYFTECIVSNRDNIQSSGGVAVQKATSTQADLNFNWFNGGIDFIKGGDALLLKHVNHIKIIGNQILSSSPTGTNCNLNPGTGCYAAIHLNDVTDFLIEGNSLASDSRDIWLESVINLGTIANNILLGDGADTVGYFVEPGSVTVGYLDITGNTTIAGPFNVASITNNADGLANVRSTLSNGLPDAFGFAVSDPFKIMDGAGASNPNKYLKVSSGSLIVTNSADNATIFTVENDGDATIAKDAAVTGHLNQASANQWAAGITITAGNTTGSFTFPTAYSSAPACVLSPTADLGAARRIWVTASTTAVTANIDSALGGNSFYAFICVGNPN